MKQRKIQLVLIYGQQTVLLKIKRSKRIIQTKSKKINVIKNGAWKMLRNIQFS